MRSIVILALVLFSGCLCFGGPFESVEGEEKDICEPPYELVGGECCPFGVCEQDENIKGQDYGTTTVTLQSNAAESISPDTAEKTSTTTHTTTSTSILGLGHSGLMIINPLCADDDMGNAMVTGYLHNPGEKSAHQVTVVARLKDGDGNVVDGGQKKMVIESISPGDTKKFSMVYEEPGQWHRCRLFIDV